MRKLVVLFSVVMVLALVAGCAAPAQQPASGGQAAATQAPAATSGGAKPYIPVISKGFQH
jgi:hypothetical protein